MVMTEGQVGAEATYADTKSVVTLAKDLRVLDSVRVGEEFS